MAGTSQVSLAFSATWAHLGSRSAPDDSLLLSIPPLCCHALLQQTLQQIPSLGSPPGLAGLCTTDLTAGAAVFHYWAEAAGQRHLRVAAWSYTGFAQTLDTAVGQMSGR